MTVVLVGAVGFFVGLAAHDLAIQSLVPTDPLRPLTGVCPQCRQRRGWHRLRCQHCGRFLTREPIFAIAVAGAAVGFQNAVGITWFLIPYLAFLLLSSALIVTDLEAFRIVDRLNLVGSAIVGVLLAVVSVLSGDATTLLRGLMGAGVYFIGASVLFILARGQGFGAGDVKLSLQLGLFAAFLSWTTLGRAVFTTAIIGGVVAVLMMTVGRSGRKAELPYGPPMILGAWTAIILTGIGSGAITP